MTKRKKKIKRIKRENPQAPSSVNSFLTPEKVRTGDRTRKEPSAPDKSGTKVKAQKLLPAVPINNAFVYDIAAYVRMKDVDTAISTLKSASTFRNLDPSELLYDELLDCLLDSETFVDAYSIYSALVWVFDREFAKNKGTKFVFPNSLDLLTQSLQDASIQQMDGDGR